MKDGLCPDMPVMVNDWLSSTSISLMTPAEEGAYFRLLCHAWNHPECLLPGDDESLAALSRLGPLWHQGSGAKIRRCFCVDSEHPESIYNERQRQARREQQGRIERIRTQRSNAVKARWSKRNDTGRNTTVSREDIRGGIRNHTSSPLSPHSSTQLYIKDVGHELTISADDSAPASKADSDATWLEGLKADTAYQGIDVEREHAKMLRWCKEHRKQATRRRFINWLNRAEKPLSESTLTPTPQQFTRSGTFDPNDL